MIRVCFIIFAHSTVQDVEDLQDMIDNIKHFHKDCDFIVNHPTIEHPKVRVRHMPGELNHSNFIFGAYEKILKTISIDEIQSFDHFCLVSANQYFIDRINFEKGVNYVQFYNTENWDNLYTGKDMDKTIIGFPLQQPYGRWDPKDLYKVYGIKTPMASNWECLTLTKESMLLAKENIDSCADMYYNQDMIGIFPGYMALMSGQPWEFPAHFGTYDPSNRKIKNQILFTQQVVEKRNDGYFSVKRVNYKKDCPIKNFIRETYYNKNENKD
jgi:hypothetical protein